MQLGSKENEGPTGEELGVYQSLVPWWWVYLLIIIGIIIAIILIIIIIILLLRWSATLHLLHYTRVYCRYHTFKY